MAIQNPFASSDDSQPQSRASSLYITQRRFPSSGGISVAEGGERSEGGEHSSSIEEKTSSKRRFQSFRLRGEYAQPWKADKRTDRVKYSNHIVYGFMTLAFLLCGYIIFTGYKSVVRHDYCLVYEDDFKTLDTSIWSHEVQLGGFGTGTFDWTTSDPANAYITPEGLRITPTLTNETTSISNAQIEHGYLLNLTSDGTCTGVGNKACAVFSNFTTGRIINPIRSARLTTKGRKSITYGRVEVTAKLPKGDWMWPAIWMMPEADTYGEWPKSGEIDIMEARGNPPSYSTGGRDKFASSLHWGPDKSSDAYWRTTAGRAVRRSDFSDKFHTFGIEWSEDYLFTYMDSRLYTVLWVGFKDKPLWQKGNFGTFVDSNSSYYVDPWSSTGRKNTPFDQPFYLILNLAVGGTDGHFPDGEGGKPWINANPNAMSDFWKSADQWLPTWPAQNDRGMTIKKIKMWQQGKCGSPN